QKHYGAKKEEGRLRALPNKGGKNTPPPVPPKHFKNRRLRDSPHFFQFRENRRLKNPKPDIQPDEDQDETEKERHAPAPLQELIVCRPHRHQSYRTIREHHSCGRAKLCPACRKAAPLRIGPFTGEENRAAPFAADADTLDNASQS